MAGCGKKAETVQPPPTENPAAVPATPESPAAAPAVPAAPAAAVEISLAKDLMPLFVRSCGACHAHGGSGAAVARGTYYDTKEDITARVGKYIIPGKPEESGVYKICAQTMPVGESKIVMPPPGAPMPAWSKEELAKLAQWIKDGAKDN
jgi:mono/diheme cytochrome c family protein